MASIEEGLKAFLEAQVPTAGKGFPIEVPQDETLPAWAYQTVDDIGDLAHDGATGFTRGRIQIAVTAKETLTESAYGAAKGIAEEMRQALDGFKGDMNGAQVEFCHTTLSDDWADLRKLPQQKFDVILHYQR